MQQHLNGEWHVPSGIDASIHHSKVPSRQVGYLPSRQVTYLRYSDPDKGGCGVQGWCCWRQFHQRFVPCDFGIKVLATELGARFQDDNRYLRLAGEVTIVVLKSGGTNPEVTIIVLESGGTRLEVTIIVLKSRPTAKAPGVVTNQ